MEKEPVTATEIVLRMDAKDRKRLMEDMPNYKGKTVKLHITDTMNRFSLGEFEAEITKWNPPSSKRYI